MRRNIQAGLEAMIHARQSIPVGILLLWTGCLLLPGGLDAAPRDWQLEPDPLRLPYPERLRPDVEFWTRIFTGVSGDETAAETSWFNDTRWCRTPGDDVVLANSSNKPRALASSSGCRSSSSCAKWAIVEQIDSLHHKKDNEKTCLYMTIS